MSTKALIVELLTMGALDVTLAIAAQTLVAPPAYCAGAAGTTSRLSYAPRTGSAAAPRTSTTTTGVVLPDRAAELLKP